MKLSFFYPFFIAFLLVFLSELGDKTQLLVLSFSTKLKSYMILLGVALGSFLSHGLAIAFGSALGGLNNGWLHLLLKFITYLSFLFFGIMSFMNVESSHENSKKSSILKKLSNLPLGYIFVISLSIAVGELGDKTFLASLGLGVQYSASKLFLILGAVLGMVVSDAIAIFLGKVLTNRISEKKMNFLSGLVFLCFGCLGMIRFFIEIW